MNDRIKFDETINEFVAPHPAGGEIFGTSYADIERKLAEAERVAAKHAQVNLSFEDWCAEVEAQANDLASEREQEAELRASGWDAATLNDGTRYWYRGDDGRGSARTVGLEEEMREKGLLKI